VRCAEFFLPARHAAAPPSAGNGRARGGPRPGLTPDLPRRDPVSRTASPADTPDAIGVSLDPAGAIPMLPAASVRRPPRISKHLDPPASECRRIHPGPMPLKGILFRRTADRARRPSRALQAPRSGGPNAPHGSVRGWGDRRQRGQGGVQQWAYDPRWLFAAWRITIAGSHCPVYAPGREITVIRLLAICSLDNLRDIRPPPFSRLLRPTLQRRVHRGRNRLRPRFTTSTVRF